MGYGRHFEALTADNLRAFLYGLPGFAAALATYRQQGNEVLFAHLDETLKEIGARHLAGAAEPQEASWGGE